LSNWWVEDLQIVFYGGDQPSGLRIDLIANPQHYRKEDLEQHCRQFVELLQEITSLADDIPVSDLHVPIGAAPNEVSSSDDLGRHRIQRWDVSPKTPTEMELANIWRDILRVQTVALDDDFFENGGDSLLANLLVTRVRKIFAVNLPLGSIFESPTLRSIA